MTDWEAMYNTTRAEADGYAARLRAIDLAEAKAAAAANKAATVVTRDPLREAQDLVADMMVSDPDWVENVRVSAWLSQSIWRKSAPPLDWPKGTDATTWCNRAIGLSDDGLSLLAPPPGQGEAEPEPAKPVTYMHDMLATMTGRKP